MRLYELAAAVATALLLFTGYGAAYTDVYTGTIHMTECSFAPGSLTCAGVGNVATPYIYETFDYSYHVDWTPDASCEYSVLLCGAGYRGSRIYSNIDGELCCFRDGTGSASHTGTAANDQVKVYYAKGYNGYSTTCCPVFAPVTIVISTEAAHIVSGSLSCVDDTYLYIWNGTRYSVIDSSTSDSYSFKIYNGSSYRLLFDDLYHDFICTGENVVFDYDDCRYVYGYSCGVDTIKLRDNNSQLIDTVAQSSGYDVYEMEIEAGEEYTISFYDMGIILCYNQTFTCTGDHVLIDYDRCNWVYPPNGGDIPIYLWAGYDYNVVMLKDNHGNLVENGKLAIYDETDDVYIQKWTDNAEGYAVLGAMFPADHDVRMMFRTFDGIFTLDTTYPANGTSLVGEEDITTTEWTIPIKYNIDIIPVDRYAVPLFDVFCGLSEYTPLDPQAFWGMDLSDRGFVPVTNCSGFAMCDIVAEKEGYADYSEIALEWTSKSAMVKDYRHSIVMEEE